MRPTGRSVRTSYRMSTPQKFERLRSTLRLLAGDRYRQILPQRSHGAFPVGVEMKAQAGRRFDEEAGAISWTARETLTYRIRRKWCSGSRDRMPR
jgi:hypothetical protein